MTAERVAEPGERCTCGRQAVTVFVRDSGAEVGYCGQPDGGDRTGPCPFCGGDRHRQPWGDPAPCPQYQLRPPPQPPADPPVDDQTTQAEHRLRQIARLVSEYAEVADHTGNADLTTLVFQLRLVLGDGHAGPIPPTPARPGGMRVRPPHTP